MAEPANQESVYRRRCGNYQQPEGENKEILQSIISLEPIREDQEVVMFIDENRVFECYTTEELRQIIEWRNILPLTNRPLGDNFRRHFNNGERTFFMVRPQDGGQVIPINRNIFFNMIVNDPLEINEQNPLPRITQRIINNEENIRRDIRQHLVLQGGNNIENEDILIEAALNNDMRTVEILVRQGVRHRRTIHIAMRNNNIEMLRFLLEHGMVSDTAVFVAAIRDNMEIVRLLVEYGMIIDNETIEVALENGNMEMVEFLQQHM